MKTSLSFDVADLGRTADVVCRRVHLLMMLMSGQLMQTSPFVYDVDARTVDADESICL